MTTKAELVADHSANPPFGTNLGAPLEAFVRVHQTSGTTGRPLRWLDTADSWDWWARCWGAVFRAAGVTPADRLFFAFSFGPFIGFWSALEGARQLGALAISGGAQTTEERIHHLLELEATVLLCTPSYALHLGATAQSLGIKLDHLRVGIHAGEPGAQLPSTRARIGEVLGVEVFDHIGMTEVGATGFECRAHPGGTHLNEGEFIFEVLDPHTGQPAHEGELVVTNLGRPATPVVRYRTGDRVRWDEAPCACGRTFARLSGGILGRVDDMVTVRGVNVFPSAIENIVRAHREVQEFRLRLIQRADSSELAIDVEVTGGQEARIAGELAAEIHRLVGLRVEVHLVAAGTLPRFELKARRLVRQ
jgi:phenylacetate-CoA ligase